MTTAEWRKFVQGLDKYFERTTSVETAMLWFDEVKNFPSEFLPWASTQLKEHDYFPRNLPLTVKNLWHGWLKVNPHKQHRETGLCSGCEGGQGWINIWKQDSIPQWPIGAPQLVWLTSVVRCPVCNPASQEYLALCNKQGSRPEKEETVQQLREAGHHVGLAPPGGYQFRKVKPPIDVELTDVWGE